MKTQWRVSMSLYGVVAAAAPEEGGGRWLIQQGSHRLGERALLARIGTHDS